MKITVATFTVHKKFPLKISRGTTSETTNLWLKITADGIEGWGEASPFSVVKNQKITTEQLLQEITSAIPYLQSFHPLQRQEISFKLNQLPLSSGTKAAIDMALHDWLGKKAGLPLWQLWGLDIKKIQPISVTVGINTPESAIKRVQDWQDTITVKILKLKLGNPLGIAADKAMIEAVKSVAPDIRLTVDANGGWSLQDAIAMSEWLSNQGVEYIEQPLPVGEENSLATLSNNSPLPIFVDESCFTSEDIPKLANSVAGVNLKIMKTGGLTEAMKAINVAKACGLKVMFGCYSDSSLANTAMAHLSPLADYLDLDSHLNLLDDPFTGAMVEDGRLLPNNNSGLGVTVERNMTM
ncbi:MAG: dipeptide epimerase [Xenococcaceae cyanobacterium MO_207.B15]|nr:dipeptide epimerase [Xenococcaceae cyanobacterium MO_207.B15]MDJ0746599.1 dipeptide epimerase [Xenococcaceae cyanobacterium MO_167.B27]